MSITKDIKDYAKNHTAKECFLYNNRNWFSNFITDKEYNDNRAFIIRLRSMEMNNKNK